MVPFRVYVLPFPFGLMHIWNCRNFHALHFTVSNVKNGILFAYQDTLNADIFQSLPHIIRSENDMKIHSDRC